MVLCGNHRNLLTRWLRQRLLIHRFASVVDAERTRLGAVGERRQEIRELFARVAQRYIRGSGFVIHLPQRQRAVAIRESLRTRVSLPTRRSLCRRSSTLLHAVRAAPWPGWRRNGYAEVKAMALRRAKLGDRVKFSERKHRVGPRARRSCSCNFLCRWLKQSDLRSWINCSSHSASETERKPRSCALLSTGAAAAIASPSAGSLAPL